MWLNSRFGRPLGKRIAEAVSDATHWIGADMTAGARLLALGSVRGSGACPIHGSARSHGNVLLYSSTRLRILGRKWNR